DICKLAKKAYDCQQVIKIFVRGNQLLDKSNFEDEPDHPEADPTISLSFLLEEGLLKDRYTFPDVHKRILAVTLAQSLLQLYQGPWIQRDWASKHLFFMYETDKVYNIHQPYLSCFLSSEAGYQSDIRDPKHNYPLILSFGRLLMEMEKGESINITKEINKRPSLYKTLKSHFDEWKKEQLTLHYADAVNGCLKFPQWMREHTLNHPGDSQEAACRKVILEKILYPLELEVRNFPETAFGTRDLDLKKKASLPSADAHAQPVHQSLSQNSSAMGQVLLKETCRITTTSLGRSRTNDSKTSSLSAQGNRARPSSGLSKPSSSLGRHPNTRDARTATTSRPRAAVYPTSGRNSLPSTRLLCAQPDTTSRPPRSPSRGPSRNRLTKPVRHCHPRPSSGKQFAKTFLASLDNFRKDYIHRVKGGPRVKIAVLDTGLNDSDANIRLLKRKIRENSRKGENRGYKDPIREKKNFTQGSDHDDDGHGTHVVGLLLTVAPEADVYVGKISSEKTVTIQDQKISAVTLLSVQALRWALNEVEADIISMSFGLDDDSDWDDEMQKAVTDAYAMKKAVFAAASNYGGNKERTYPAKAETVFCIHATDGNGNESEVDPTPLRNCDNFSTLGVAVPCGFSGDEEVFKTGTSYSTPIAAGIAANIMDLADWLQSEEELTLAQRNKLRSYEGMKGVFRLMAPQQRQDYDYVAPWNLWNGKADERTIWGKIKERL
ncbi:peptidase S8/S53 domain-containing protein, partial [Thelonectria olida]